MLGENSAALGQRSTAHPGQSGRHAPAGQRCDDLDCQVGSFPLAHPADTYKMQRISPEDHFAARSQNRRPRHLVGHRADLAMRTKNPQIGGELVGDGGHDVRPPLHAQYPLGSQAGTDAKSGAAVCDSRPVLGVEPGFPWSGQGVRQKGRDGMGVDDVAARGQRSQSPSGLKYLVGP